MAVITVSDLTSATLQGEGVFDVLMRANKAHLEQEFEKGRIKGSEYATVYLGSVTQVMATALQFLLSREKINLEAQLLEKQILLANIEVQKAGAQLTQLAAQTALIEQQKVNLQDELVTSAKQRSKLDQEIATQTAQAALVDQQKTNLIAEAANIPKQGQLIDAQVAQSEQQTINLVTQKQHQEAQTLLVNKQIANATLEGNVLVAQECKLKAEYDLLILSKDRSAQETLLLAQKVATEKAQILAIGVDDNSVIGKQKALYTAQTNGFARDAEVKVADLMVKTWSVRRSTDDATVADSVNKLDDETIGRAVTKALAGVAA